MKNETVSGTVTLAHGAGGKQTSELIDRIFKRHFANPLFTADDAAVIEMEKGRIAMSTDSFIVSPAFFAGGNIGLANNIYTFPYFCAFLLKRYMKIISVEKQPYNDVQ